ncbi:hypothetical protein L1887_59815 [Cichorium endivia]|nr:hypothetical protein L1887_59815 [Cichorium endivia]
MPSLVLHERYCESSFAKLELLGRAGNHRNSDPLPQVDCRATSASPRLDDKARDGLLPLSSQGPSAARGSLKGRCKALVCTLAVALLTLAWLHPATLDRARGPAPAEMERSESVCQASHLRAQQAGDRAGPLARVGSDGAADYRRHQRPAHALALGSEGAQRPRAQRARLAAENVAAKMHRDGAQPDNTSWDDVFRPHAQQGEL